MANTICIRVLRAYRKATTDGQGTVVPVDTVLDEEKGLAIQLITSNKAERASRPVPPDETPPDDAAEDAAEEPADEAAEKPRRRRAPAA